MIDANFHDCGLAKTLKVIGSKWTLAIIYQLGIGEQRFNDLQKSLSVSPRTLSARLQQLEQDDIIARTVIAQSPPHVEYTLTEKGKSLDKIIKNLSDWGEHSRPTRVA